MNLTIYLPAKMAQQVARHPEINWSEVCRVGIRAELQRLAKHGRCDQCGRPL